MTTEKQLDVEGRVLRRGDGAYEAARRDAVFNGRKPDRFPDIIVAASSTNDVAKAVRFARAREMKVAVRSGGHTSYGAALRDGSLLVDVSALQASSIDATTRIARVQPGVTGAEFAHALAEHGLAFPVGHCGTVPLSGYLLSGGLGWNMGTWGAACFSVRSVEVVTADGDIVVADERRNSDLFWAARGAGAGFFGVATGFELAVYPAPKTILLGTHAYPLAHVEEVSNWAAEARTLLPANVEMILSLGTAPPDVLAGPAGVTVGVMGVAFAESDEEARSSLATLQTCPVQRTAVASATNVPVTFEMLNAMVDESHPKGDRYFEDSSWSDRGLGELLPRLGERFVGAPSPKSHVLIAARPPVAHRLPPDTAFSTLGSTLVLGYAIWEEEHADAANERWFRDLMGAIDDLATGNYLAETDLSADPSKAASSFTPEAWRRLQALKKEHDPDGLFHDYLGFG